MLKFKKLDMSERTILDGYVERSGTVGSDYSIGSWFSWYDVDTIEWTEERGALYVKAQSDGETVFLSPLTDDENYAAAVDEIHSYCIAEGIPFKVVFATENQVKHIKNYKLSIDIGNSEYIYNPADLIKLEGTRYHGKRNHIHRFTSSYDYEFVPYTEADFDGVVALMNLWGENRERLPFEEEKRALINMLTTEFAPKRMADVIKIGGKVVGLSVGEITPSNVGVVLFEKADMQYEGIFTAINQMFAERHFQNVRYINRQEDMNIEGLRRAKRSYCPVMMLDKYTITEPESVQLRALYAEAFEDSENFIAHFFESMAPRAKIITVEENGTVVSALYAFPKKLMLGGTETDCVFITAVATLKSVRGRGYMTKLLDKALAELHADGIPLAALYPFKPDFYSRFGFVTVDNYEQVVISPTENGRYSVTACADAKLLSDAYAAFTDGMSYFEVRGEREFSARLAELHADGGTAYLIEEKGKPCGYFLYSGGVEEGAYDLEMISAADFLMGESVPVLSDGEGGAQVRIVNVRQLGERFKCDSLGSFRVTDDVIAENDGCYLSDGNGLTKLPDDTTDCPVKSVEELTRHLFDVCGKGRKKGYFVDRY